MRPNGAPDNRDISETMAAEIRQPSNDDTRLLYGGPKYGGLGYGLVTTEGIGVPVEDEIDSHLAEVVHEPIGLLGKEAFGATFNSLRLAGHYVREEYGSLTKLKEKAIQSAKTIAGYAIVLSGATAVALEQLPVNENWRVKEAFNTLKATGSPWAVTERVFTITNEIEVAASAVVALAVFSNNTVVQAPKEALYRWSEKGEKREEYRAEVKADEKDFRLKVGNNWRVAQGKKPKGMSKVEKHDYKYGRKIEEASSRLEKVEKIKHFPLAVVSEVRTKEEAKIADLNSKLEAKKEKIRLKEQKGKRTDNLGAKVVKIVSKEMEDFGIALGLGAAIVVFNNGVRNRNYNLKNFAIDTVKSSLAIASVSAFIAWTVATGTQKAKLGIPLTDYTLHYEDQAKFIVDYGLNTKAIIGALLVAQSPAVAKKLWHRMPKREAKFQQWLAEKQQAKEQYVGGVALATN